MKNELKRNLETLKDLLPRKGYTLRLDLVTCYGGYRLEYLNNNTHCPNNPFKETRLSSKEMITYTDGIIKGLDIKRMIK